MSEWTMRKCPCGDPICKQYTISIQGSVGFDEESARLICAAPKLLNALIAAREALHAHYVEWDGEPEDAVPLQLACAECDLAIAEATPSDSTPA